MNLVDPFLGRMVRRVRGTGDVIEEEGLAGIDLVDAVQVIDGVVGHSGDQVPSRLPHEGINLRRVAEQVRLPLVRVAADEPVEVIEALPDRPILERSNLAGREGRHVVVLAEPRGGVAVFLEDSADGRLVLGDDAVVARESRGLFGYHAEAGRVMVAPGDQRGARRRAERGGVDVVVAQAVFREAIHRRRRDDAAERAGYAKAGVIRHDEENVGSLFGRDDAWRPPGFGMEGILLDHTAEFRIGRRDLVAGERSGSAGRPHLACDLHRHGRSRRKETQQGDGDDKR